MIKSNENRTKILFLCIAAICICTVLVITAIIRQKTETTPEIFEYTALGDSIPNGYIVSEDDSMKSYPCLLAEDIEKTEEIPVNLSEYTKNGLTTDGLCEKYLSDAEVQEDLKKADLITVTIGANDLLNKFRKLYQEIFEEDAQVRDIETVLKVIREKTADNPGLLAEAAEMIYRWDCENFEKGWKKAMESISRNQKEDAQVIVTTIYNPVGAIEASGILYQVIGGVIDQMNRIITENAKLYGYQTADLSGAVTEEKLQPDRLHPNQQGQQMIMEKIMEKYQKKQEIDKQAGYLCQLHLSLFSCKIFR